MGYKKKPGHLITLATKELGVSYPPVAGIRMEKLLIAATKYSELLC